MPDGGVSLIASALIAGAGTAATSAAAGSIAWGAVAASTALGAAVAGLGYLTNTSKGASKRDRENDFLQTKSQRNLAVPVIFGRARVAANYVQLGNFFFAENMPRLGIDNFVTNAIYSIAEGPIRAAGNFRIGGSTLRRFREDLKLDLTETTNYLYLDTLPGSASQDLTGKLGDFYGHIDPEGDKPAFNSDPSQRLPYRNTALLLARTICGSSGPAFLDITLDVLGPDFTVRRSGAASDGSKTDTPFRSFYDGHTEAYYYTVDGSDSAEPWGLFRRSRFGGSREHTPPPVSMTENARRAWYLGRHDVLVIQNGDHPSRFHIGFWGIEPDSTEWELGVSPIDTSDYANPIILDYLDELNGVLHTLHDDGSQRYVMRWHLLDGKVDRWPRICRTRTGGSCSTRPIWPATSSRPMTACASSIRKPASRCSPSTTC